MLVPGPITAPFIEASADGGAWVTLTTTVLNGNWQIETQLMALPAATSTIRLRMNPPAACKGDYILDDFKIT